MFRVWLDNRGALHHAQNSINAVFTPRPKCAASKMLDTLRESEFIDSECEGGHSAADSEGGVQMQSRLPCLVVRTLLLLLSRLARVQEEKHHAGN